MATTLQESTTLDQVLDPFADCLTPDVAQRIANLQPAPQLQRGLDELRAKANEGMLSSAEQAEYEELIDSLLDLLGILKAKARTWLACRSS